MPHYPYFGNPAVYVDPTIVSFVADPAIAELGSTVSSVVLKWEIAKKPLTLTVNGADLPPSTRQTSVTGSFTTNQSWPLKCGDVEQITGETGNKYSHGKTQNAKATLTFLNRVFYGYAAAAPTDSASIMALDYNELSGTKQRTVTIGAPSGKVFCFAYPKRLGVPRKVIISVSTGLWQPTTKDLIFTDYTLSTVVGFTNASGFSEDYYVLAFNAAVADSTVVTIS